MALIAYRLFWNQFQTYNQNSNWEINPEWLLVIRKRIKLSYLLHLHYNLPFSIWRFTTAKDKQLMIFFISKQLSEQVQYLKFLKERKCTPELLCKSHKYFSNWHSIMVLLQNDFHLRNLNKAGIAMQIV